MENLLTQLRQTPEVVSVNLTEATPDHITQIERTDVVRFEFVFELDTLEHVPVDIIVPVEIINENTYLGFVTGIDSLLGCDCVVTNPTHNDRVLRDVNISAFNNIGKTTYYIRPTDGWMVPIYGEYADEITPTDPIFVELIEKLKNVAHVLEVNVEKLLDTSILTQEERSVTHVFFRIKHTINETTESRNANFIASEPSCCNLLQHESIIAQLENLIKIETPDDQLENLFKLKLS